MTHFHANIIEDSGAERDARTLDATTGPFLTREAAQARLFVEAGSLAGRPSWALTDARVGGDGLDVVEFYSSRSGAKIILSAWGCQCEDGERTARSQR